jgi:hypothetical protein
MGPVAGSLGCMRIGGDTAGDTGCTGSGSTGT